jgi:3-deoxy-manno-octulosonate cytidylyltransferase (CMP-KDO synthetase)
VYQFITYLFQQRKALALITSNQSTSQPITSQPSPMRILGIIPARYASTRFPGKPLADIGGKSMIQRVYEQVLKSGVLDAVVVATDDERIAQELEQIGAKYVMTDPEHLNGTMRCAEVMTFPAFKGFDAAINIQGDEPFINPEQIELVAETLEGHPDGIATLVRKITDPNLYTDINVVKAVLAKNGRALYFSRSPLPFYRSGEFESAYQHLGIYGYPTKVLARLATLNASPLELAENLEQLRWLENDIDIYTAATQHATHAVDTPADLERLKGLVNED